MKGTLDGHALVAVGPGLAGSLLVTGGYAMNPLPVQPAKIHCPPERSDTLSRPRLNSWLDRAAVGRLGLVVAEAGFGKTTLLGDWARHTRRLTAWYRLESDDRDWLTFIRHLVAAGRELDPDFAPVTFAALIALGSGSRTAKDLALGVAREYAAYGAAHDRGLTLIIDDYHLVDGSSETDPVVKALLDHTDQGFSVILASRSMPTLPLGRLKARGSVMTLDGQALCFDERETAILFSDAYRLRLDDDVVADLHARTEGWAALLSLVKTRLIERRDPRAFVAQLMVSRGDIYDFLAEEVLAALPADLTRFLTRAAILTRVEPAPASIVDGQTEEAARTAIAHAERLGLLTRPDRESPHRFHPLVREFLESHLVAEIGREAVCDLHRLVAARLPSASWSTKAWHLLMAGDRSACEAVVDSALEHILASGELEQAKRFLEPDAGDPQRPAVLVLRSKIEAARGAFDRAVRWARLAVDRSEASPLRGACLLNLASTLGMNGMTDEAAAINQQALEHELSPIQRYVAQGYLALLRGSRTGDLQEIAEWLDVNAAEQQRLGFRRYAGISRLNLSVTRLWLGAADVALRDASHAEALLGGAASDSIERVAATLTRAVARAQLGQLDAARGTIAEANSAATGLHMPDASLETARMEVEFGSVSRAEIALKQVDPSQLSPSYVGLYLILAGDLAIRQADLVAAQDVSERLVQDRCADVAGALRTAILGARIAMRVAAVDSIGSLARVDEIAQAQNTPRGRYLARLLRSLATREALDEIVAQGDASEAYCWSLLAEELSEALPRLTGPSFERIKVEAQLRPERWASALRHVIASDGNASIEAARLLAEIGSADDATWLRGRAVTRKSLRIHANLMTQRLAERVQVADLGVVAVTVGDDPRVRPLRRKVLALLCYLASRPRMAASREEAIDALWPEIAPDAGGNSMHQAIYSMRRVFEPGFKEGLSANYIQFDGDVVSLHPDLVDTTSRRCWRLLARVRGGDHVAFDELEGLYSARYALTFAYDDWAATYRENLHAAVLAAAEAEMVLAMRDADYERSIRIGHSILTIDPHADAIEFELLRAYKRSGRHAAAAEQYAHYAAYVRQELAADPPSYDDV